MQPSHPDFNRYKPVNPDSRVAAGLDGEGSFSYQIDGNDVSIEDGFGAAIGHDSISPLAFGFSQIPKERWDEIFRKD